MHLSLPLRPLHWNVELRSIRVDLMKTVHSP